MDGKDGHELKLQKIRPAFSSFNAIPAKIKGYVVVSAQSPMKLVRYFVHNSTGASNDVSTG